jgi:nucleoside diphosphate kinase
MSVAQALEFYGPVESALEKKLSPVAGRQARQYLEERFNIHLDDEMEKTLTETFGFEYARNQFHKIVEFMSGYSPSECTEEQKKLPGRVKSMALVYEGESAVEKIRSVLGPTDPTQAPGGTIRKEFGSDVMVNTAHASDSPANAAREMKIVNIEANPLSSLILEYLAGAGA